ncbi:MAG: HEPN domain-containing protein [Clostridium sp.]|nr:HEPN domain-containing protein [Clostridium sp.]
MLTDYEREQIVKLRLEKAEATLKEAELLMQGGLWSGVVNRIYYVCYYMVSALLVKNGIEATTHAGVRTMLGLHFLKTGKISKEMGVYFSTAFTKRQTSDYDEFIGITQEEAEELFDGLSDFMEAIMTLIKS